MKHERQEVTPTTICKALKNEIKLMFEVEKDVVNKSSLPTTNEILSIIQDPRKMTDKSTLFLLNNIYPWVKRVHPWCPKNRFLACVTEMGVLRKRRLKTTLECYAVSTSRLYPLVQDGYNKHADHIRTNLQNTPERGGVKHNLKIDNGTNWMNAYTKRRFDRRWTQWNSGGKILERKFGVYIQRYKESKITNKTLQFATNRGIMTFVFQNEKAKQNRLFTKDETFTGLKELNLKDEVEAINLFNKNTRARFIIAYER